MKEKIRGHIEVIYGPMYAGKTALLIERLSAWERLGARVAAFKHTIDTRYQFAQIVSHDKLQWPAVRVSRAEEIAEHAVGQDVIGVDEAHFFGPELIDVILHLSTSARVIVAGLDLDAWKRPFPPIPEIAEIATSVSRLRAKCAICGSAAEFTQRLRSLDERDLRVGRTQLVGGSEIWAPRCELHFEPLRDDDSSPAR